MAADRARPRGLGTLAFVAATVGLIGAALHGAGPASQSAASAPAANPHWKAEGCSECHGGDGNRYSPVKRDAIDGLCLKCHDGSRARREIHPVGRRFVPEEIVLPAGWPAPADRLGCVTCHDIRQGCDGSKRRPEANPQFLRTPPSGTKGGFCGACHTGAAQATGGRYNPHKMMNEKGEAVTDACLFCHDSALNLKNRTVREGSAHLRADGVSLCVGCHPRHRDYFEPGHIGIAATPQFMARLRMVAPSTAIPTTMPQTQPAQRAEPMRLPLENGKRIVCSTCHNPHSRGVFTAGSELSSGEMSENGKNRLALRGPDKDVCRVCHDQ